MEQEALESRTSSERASNLVASHAGLIWFPVLHVTVFLLWIVWNSGLVPALKRFEKVVIRNWQQVEPAALAHELEQSLPANATATGLRWTRQLNELSSRIRNPNEEGRSRSLGLVS